MADVGKQFCLSLDFASEKLGPDVLWFNPPAKYQLRSNGSSGVKIFSVSCTQLEVQVLWQVFDGRTESNNFKTINEWGWVSYEQLWRSRRITSEISIILYMIRLNNCFILTSIDVTFIFDSAGLGLLSSANILQIADVAHRVVFLLFLPCFSHYFA